MMRPIFLLMCLSLPASAGWDLSKMVTGSGGKRVFHGLPVDKKLVNPWPASLEKEFQARARDIIDHIAEKKGGVNTYFENEKRSYGVSMAHVLCADEEKSAKALADLQDRDAQDKQWHRETAGIDYYAAFTLKHQMRKYFYFGDLLEPAYRKQMFDGAKRWAAKDPLRRPHYAFRGGKEGWGPDVKNSWVDIRSTENLYLMRNTSVYLMAEETGNKNTTALYKKHILDYTKTLYRIGIGEWDSENYHGHSVTPLLNLYDFAKDPEVAAAAKACLDFYAAAGALKYYRGGFNGPTKRDYNHAQPFGGSAANSMWVWFGEHPTGKTDDWESDEIHMITSSYRPPLAVVNLARKRFDKPFEVFAAKPEYEATTRYLSESKPEHLETQFIAHSYLMGSLTGGTSVDGGDVNGFKILAYDKEDGAVALHAVPGANPSYPGSPMYKRGIVSTPNRVAQHENLVLWLVNDGKSPWLWVVPEGVRVSEKGNFTFLECDRTWVAVQVLGGGRLKTDAAKTKQLLSDKKTRFPGHKVLSAKGGGKGYCGLVVEVGEKESHSSFAGFQKAVLSAQVDVAKLDEGIATYQAGDGKSIGIRWADDPLALGVWRNGEQRDLVAAAGSLYSSPLINAEWGGGVLEVTAGGESFRCAVDENGKVVFK